MDYRLKKTKDFDILFKKGKRAFSKSMVLLYCPASEFKFGISVSKKHGHAVVRNKIKRLLRACFRQLKNEIGGNYHIVFLPKVSDGYSYEVFYRDMKYLLSKEKLLNVKKSIDNVN